MAYKKHTTATCTGDDHGRSCQKACREQFLFLLELYVRCINSPRLAKLNEMFCVPTTVTFRFLDFTEEPDLQLTPVDPIFEPQSGLADRVEPFFSGKSVLFALGHEIVADIEQTFRIDLAVSKRMPDDIKPDVLVGRAKVDMSMHFAALRKEIIECTKYAAANAALPNPSKVFDDEVPLCFDGGILGSINLYARISAFGQTIITEFETPCIQASSVSSFLFKAQDPNCEERGLRYRCRVLDPAKCDVEAALEEDEGAAGEGPPRPRDCPLCKPAKLPCGPCALGSGARLAAGARPETTTQRRRGCGEQQQAGQPVGSEAEASATCVVDSCRPIQSSRGPKEPCGKAVVLKVSGLLDVPGDACREHQARVTVLPESEAACADDLADPDHDVFILRIGKKGLVGADEKSDIQLEMRTPKGPERRPPLRLETREIQTEGERKKGAAAAAAGGKKKK